MVPNLMLFCDDCVVEDAGEDFDLPSEFTHKNDRPIGIEDFELLKVSPTGPRKAWFFG